MKLKTGLLELLAKPFEYIRGLGRKGHLMQNTLIRNCDSENHDAVFTVLPDPPFSENGNGFVQTRDLTPAKMSATSWRQREIEKARARKEQAARLEEEARTKTIQKTETNFPSMSGGGSQWGGAAGTTFGTSFSSMAQQWATEEKIDKTMEAYRAQKAAKQARENAVHGVVLFPTRRRPVREEYEEEEEPEEETCEPSEDDWTEVRNGKLKVRRELTNAELEQKYRDAGREEDADDGEHNRELFDREW